MLDAVTIGGMRALYGRPQVGNQWPGIVVLHEIFGLNEDIQRIAQRFIDEGYAVVAPDLYSPGPTPICIARTVLDMARGGGATVERIGAVRAWMAAQPGVDGRRLGVIGFCMGGGFALVSAATHAFDVASVNYGRVPAETAALEGVCPVVASYGGRDRALLSHAGRLADFLQRRGIPHDVKIYPGATHSFMNQGAPQWMSHLFHVGYDHEASEDAWTRILAFLGERLKPVAPAAS